MEQESKMSEEEIKNFKPNSEMVKTLKRLRR